MGKTVIKLMPGSRKTARYLVEINDFEDYVNYPLKLETHLFDILDTIINTCSVPLKISVDTGGWEQVKHAVDLYDFTSTALAKYRRRKPVKIFTVH